MRGPWMGFRSSTNYLQLCTVKWNQMITNSVPEGNHNLNQYLMQSLIKIKVRTLGGGINELRNYQKSLSKSSSQPRLWVGIEHS